MDLSFLTGNVQPSAGAFQWMGSGNNQQAFNTPAMNYQPSQSNTGLNMAGGTSAGALGGLGMNIPTFQLGLGALGSLAGIYSGFQANKLAKDQLSFTKDITNTNLNNQIKSYNTALEDRARSRATAENRDQSTADEYIAANRLSR